MFRNKQVGIFDGDKVVRLGTPAKLIPELIDHLFKWYKESPIHPLIKSCVFHYEFEFIHPFADGNGRMGRMWHTLLLYQWKDIFAWLPIETIVKERQTEYYSVLAQSDISSESTVFVEFMLQTICDALTELVKSEQDSEQVNDQVKRLLECMGNKTLSGNELMEKLALSHKGTFRKNYLNPALKEGAIVRTIPDKPNSRNQKYKRR